MLNGLVIKPFEEDTWVVPYKFYSLSKLKVWKQHQEKVSGFEVVYEVPANFYGYPPITHMFGSRQYVSHYETVDLSDVGDIVALNLSNYNFFNK